MRIAYVTETFPPELNGVSLTVERTVRFLRARGHQVDLLRPAPAEGADAVPEDEWRSSGFPIPMYPTLRFGAAWPATVQARLVSRAMELMHVATTGPLGWAAVRAARAARLAVSSDFRTNFHQYSGYYGLTALQSSVLRWLRHFHNQSQRTFVPTRQVQAELSRCGFQHLFVLGRGVDTAAYAPAHRDPALRASWTPADRPVLLYVGRLAVEKNVELALRAYEVARTLCPGARMVVVGDGPLRKRLEALHPSVLFTGELRGELLSRHYASADIFLFPSQSETFGNVTLEAMASGLAVVAFDTAAAGQYLRSGESAALAVPGDCEGFVQACAELVLAPQRCLQLGLRARQLAVGLQWDAVLGDFESELAEVLHAHQKSAAAPRCMV